MDPTSVIDDAEFWLPPEFLTDEDFLVEKENNGVGIDDSNSCLFPYEPRHVFGGLCSAVKPDVRSSEKKGDEENLLAGLTKQMLQSSLDDDFFGGFCGSQGFPAGNDDKAWPAWGTTRSPLCVAGNGGCYRNQRSDQNSQTRVSSQAAWDLYCAAAEEVARIKINDEPYGYNNNESGRGLLASPRKVSAVAATAAPVKNHPISDSAYYNHHQSLLYQKLQAIQYQQLKQQQLMKQHRQLVQQSRGVILNSNKNGGPVDLSSSAWPNQPLRRDGFSMRAVFLGDQTGKRGSTGTGVFLPRSVNNTSRAKTRDEKPTLTTVLVPARVAPFLKNVNIPVRSSPNLNDVSWRQRSDNGLYSSQMHGGVRTEQPVNEPCLPSEWAY